MKIVYIGGQKSGKTSLAIERAVKLSKKRKPFYVATYSNIYNDKEMKKRIKKHKRERKGKFITLEEGKDLIKVTKKRGVYLIDCFTIWIFNQLDRDIKSLKKELKKLLSSKNDMIFIINQSNLGVTPIDRESRKFIDYNGILGQLLLKRADEVINVIYGVGVKIK